MDIKGIDVSSHQGLINWEEVKPHIDFAILRCGFGGNIASQDDPQFIRNANECTRLGIPFGIYLYSYAINVDQAKNEAEHALRLAKNYKLEYPIYYDVEDKSQAGLSNDKLTDMVTNFCNTVEQAGYYVGIYANLFWFNTKLNSASLDRYDKWVAQWNDELTYNKPAGMWQYTSNGSIPGINSRVDEDIAFKNYPVIIKERGLNHLDDDKPTPEPEPEPSKLKYKLNDKLILNGRLYLDSYGHGPGRYETNKQVTITLINNNVNATKPYNVNNGLGWVAEDSLSPINSNQLNVGDKVRIVSTGKSSKDGSGRTSYGLGWEREILKIHTGSPYPYQVGNQSGTTGYYKKEALKKL